MTDTPTFSNPFPPELRHKIIAYLPLIDLKSYSLCCRVFNADSEPLLSHSIAVTPQASGAAVATLHDFVAFLMSNHRRAASIRSLSFYTAVHSSEERTVDSATIDAKSTGTFNGALHQAFSLLKNLKRLRIMPIKRPEQYYIGNNTLVAYPQDLYRALIAAPFSWELRILIVGGEPMEVTHSLLDAFPNITTLSMPLEVNPANFPPSPLPMVCRAHGNCELLAWLSGRADLLEFQSSEYRLDLKAFEDHIQNFPSLRRLSCSWAVLAEGGAEWEPDLSRFAHPMIQELELGLQHMVNPIGTSFALQFVLDIISPNSLVSIPCLRFLHIGHFGTGIARAIAAQYNLDSDFSLNSPLSLVDSPLSDICQTLLSRLDSNGCPNTLLRVWIDLGGFDYDREVALRIRAERETGGQWGVSVEQCIPHERLVTIRELQ